MLSRSDSAEACCLSAAKARSSAVTRDMASRSWSTSSAACGAATGLQVYADEKKPNVGHFFMALDPTAFRPLDEFRRDMDRLARELKDSPRAQGQERIYVHGEKSFARMERFRKEGIPLDPKVVDGLRKIGTDLGIAWPA